MTLIQASLERLESSGHRTDGFLEAFGGVTVNYRFFELGATVSSRCGS